MSTSGYRHGIYHSEVPTSIVPPVKTTAGLIVAFGVAPINQLDDPASAVNVPILAYSYDEAVAAIGFSTDYNRFTLSEVVKVCFGLYAIAPVVFVNVLDPIKHSTNVPTEDITLDLGQATLEKDGVLNSSVVLMSKDETPVTYVLNTDYTLAFDDDGFTVVTRIKTGAITSDTAELTATYTFLDPDKVTPDDIIGGIDINSDAKTGLELLNDVYPRFGLVPGQVISPRYCTNAEVGQLMAAKASVVSDVYAAEALTDIPTLQVKKYSDANAWKNTNGWTAANQTVCWPMVKLGDDIYHHSTHLAAVTALLDSNTGDIPSHSPSNKQMMMDSSVLADGTEVWLQLGSANYLNGQGIVTQYNRNGWVTWGNRTAAYPGTSDPKDAFRVCRRMFSWTENSLVNTYWSKIDDPANRRLIDSVVTSANIWFNGLAANGDIAGGRVDFMETENPTTDLMDGIMKFHVYLTPYSPAREMDFIMEYDPSYLNNLFSTGN